MKFCNLSVLFLVGAIALFAAGFPAPATDLPAPANQHSATAVLAGGCFWGMEAVFERLDGVHDVVAGYAGGSASTAQYETVGTGRTGHAESIRITYDPARVSYGKLLQVYFAVAHDPTELNRQGPDEGTQYRSAIFYSSDAQKNVAEAYIQQLDQAKIFRHRIVTQVVPLPGFYRAEGYHQHYLQLHPDNPYIVYNDLPKLKNLEREFPELLKH